MVCLDVVVVTLNCAGELVALAVPREDLCAIVQVAYGRGLEAPSTGVGRGRVARPKPDWATRMRREPRGPWRS